MQTLESLVHQHDEIRRQLEALEAALQMQAMGDVSLVVREFCFRLTRQLREHIRHECALISTCQRPLSIKELMALAEGHGEEARTLHDALHRLTIAESSQERLAAMEAFPRAMAIFRSHMDEQEYKLFPALAWVLKLQGARWSDPWAEFECSDEVLTETALVP